MIYKKHILTKSNFSSHIHLMYIQLAKESIEYKIVSTHFMTTAERVKTRRKKLKRFLLMDDKRNDIY